MLYSDFAHLGGSGTLHERAMGKEYCGGYQLHDLEQAVEAVAQATGLRVHLSWAGKAKGTNEHGPLPAVRCEVIGPHGESSRSDFALPIIAVPVAVSQAIRASLGRAPSAELEALIERITTCRLQ
jgi:hypothetical protein